MHNIVQEGEICFYLNVLLNWNVKLIIRNFINIVVNDKTGKACWETLLFYFTVALVLREEAKENQQENEYGVSLNI